MLSFLISLAALVLGYIFYGSFVDRIFGPRAENPIPAITKSDGVDFVPMPAWKVYMIQFLNIAGTGPIFGAIMGAKFGPSSFLWIVLGCIFAGAVHDYFTGMLSVRHGGCGLPGLVRTYLGNGMGHAMRIFSILLLLLVGVVFVYSPALILGDIAGDNTRSSVMIWVGVIFIYYMIATMLPVDKIIGKIYPVFAVSLIFMAVALCVCLVAKWPSIPEFWDGLGNMGPSVGMTGQDIFPCLFITIACGAISGFHATQSPLMARCIKSEKLGRPIFYGSMITEGVVALIWATVSSWFFFDGGAAEVGGDLASQAPAVVTKVSSGWLGVVGGVLAILGVVAAPITSGDTAFRSARLIIAEYLNLDQKSYRNRFAVCIPIFAVAILLLWFNVANADGFNVIWRYFGWANQTLACFTLWTATVWLTINKPAGSLYYLITLIPACFMTAVTVTFLCVDKIGFALPAAAAPWLGVGVFVACAVLYYCLRRPKAL